MQQHTTEFLIAEYNDRRARIHQLIDQVVRDRHFGLIATAAFWSWVMTQETSPPFRLILWLPAFMSAFFLLQFCVYFSNVYRISGYLKAIEAEFDLPEGVGWETHQANYCDHPPLLKRLAGQRALDWLNSSLTWMTIGYWVLLIIFNVLAPFWV